jgi:hypothetical protein
MKRHKKFKPTHEYIQSVVTEFEKRGGKVGKIDFLTEIEKFKNTNYYIKPVKKN